MVFCLLFPVIRHFHLLSILDSLVSCRWFIKPLIKSRVYLALFKLFPSFSCSFLHLIIHSSIHCRFCDPSFYVLLQAYSFLFLYLLLHLFGINWFFLFHFLFNCYILCDLSLYFSFPLSLSFYSFLLYSFFFRSSLYIYLTHKTQKMREKRREYLSIETHYGLFKKPEAPEIGGHLCLYTQKPLWRFNRTILRMGPTSSSSVFQPLDS